MGLDVSREMLMGLPLGLAIIGLLSSLVGIAGMNVFKNVDPAKALTLSEVVAGALFLVATAVVLNVLNFGFGVFWAILAGTVAGFFNW